MSSAIQLGRRRAARNSRGRWAVEALEERRLLATFSFDPDGPGPLPVIAVGGIDMGLGNALGVGSVPAVVGQTFQLDYQATIANLIAPGGGPIATTGLNSTFELTVVGSFTEVVTSVSNQTVTFQLAPTQSPNSFLELYFDNSTDSNNLTGTGFNNGTRILSGVPDTSTVGAGQLTLALDANNEPIIEDFDQFGTNNYPNILSVVMGGAAELDSRVTATDPAFFPSPIIRAAFNTSLVTPFLQSNPSAVFAGLPNGAAPAVVPAIGQINGQTGPDFQFQADANAALTPAVAQIAIVKTANGQDANTPTGPVVLSGSAVTYGYSVTDPGNTSIANVVVVDDNATPNDPSDDFSPTFTGGDTNGNGLLDPGETWTYTASRPAVAGQSQNTAKVTGTDTLNEPVTASDVANVFGAVVGVAVEKSASAPGSSPGPGGVLQVPTGTPVTFTYIVTNTGNVPLSGIVVTDDNGTPNDPSDDFSPTFVSGDTNGDGKLDVTETWTYQATRQLPVGPYSNQAEVVGNGPVGPPTRAEDQTTVNVTPLAAAIGLTKTTTGTVVTPQVVSLLRLGYHSARASIVLTFNLPLNAATAQNLANYTLTDAKGRAIALRSAVYNAAAQTVTLKTAKALPLHKIYTLHFNGLTGADGTPVNGGSFTRNFGDESFRLNPERGQAFPSTAGAIGPIVAAGSTVTFSYAVSNPGSSALTNVVLNDDAGTPGNSADDFRPTFIGGDTNGNGQLDPGETWSYTATRLATVGQYTNTAIVSATPATGGPVSATAVSNHFGLAPVVVGLTRFGVHDQPTRLVLTYSGPLDPAGAEMLSHYTLTASNGKAVSLRSATYNAAARTVTLTTTKPLNIKVPYTLTAAPPFAGGPSFTAQVTEFTLASTFLTPSKALPSGPLVLKGSPS